jgi:flagellar secretion chaperone FliS
MSYSSNAAIAYRERDVLTATPGRLVVIVFDHLLVSLRRARFAMEAGKQDQQLEAVASARAAVMELLVTTDIERGGDIAKNLRALYVFLFNELLTLGHRKDVAKLDKLVGVVTPLREAFAAIAEKPVSQTPAA